MGSIVVDHQVEVQLLRHFPVDQPQEGQEVLVTVALLTLGDDATGGGVQGGEKGGRAVADVVVRIFL